MNNIYIPATSLEDWSKRLASETHWRDGYSAKLTAESWHHADGFPSPIAAALQAAGNPFNTFEPLLILPEHQVPIPPMVRVPLRPMFGFWRRTRKDWHPLPLKVKRKKTSAQR